MMSYALIEIASQFSKQRPRNPKDVMVELRYTKMDKKLDDFIKRVEAAHERTKKSTLVFKDKTFSS